SLRAADDLGHGPHAQFVEFSGNSAALRNREEEFDPANRLRQCAEGAGRSDPRSHHGSVPYAAASDFDDYVSHHRGPGAHGTGTGDRRGTTFHDRGDDHRRPVVVPAADTAAGSRRLPRRGSAGKPRASPQAGVMVEMATQTTLSRESKRQVIRGFSHAY